MRMARLSLVSWMGIGSCFIHPCAQAQDATPFTTGELFRAKAVVVPEQEQSFERDVLEQPWDLGGEQRGNLTFFSEGVGGLQATAEGALRFRAAAPRVTLGWGNYQGKQPAQERIHLWTGPFEVKVEARQRGDKPSQWSLRFWSDGALDATTPPPQVSLEAGEWQELVFPRAVVYYSTILPGPDGFELTIAAAEGAEIEIRDLEVVRRVHEGYLRKEFEIPQGAIWRAVASVGNEARLYVNGLEVPDQSCILARPLLHGAIMYSTKSVDLEPYLKPGRNCLGVCGRRPGHPPHLYLQGQVVMRSGETVSFGTDETWRWSPHSSPGWSSVAFDNDEWSSIGTGGEAARAVRGWMLNYKQGHERPAYEGCLVLENPYEAKLFYPDHRPFALSVGAPDGLAARRPVVHWSIQRYEGGVASEIRSGSQATFTRRGDALVYQIQADSLSRGVYTVQVTMRAGDEVIEQHIPEPFVVVGRLPMTEVDGDTYEQGMELTLEDEIDFTDATDPHPWMETDGAGTPSVSAFRRRELPAVTETITEPLIVERNGLRYRETRAGQAISGVEGNVGAQFSYKVQFEHPGDFYLMALEYPDDGERWIGVSCTPAVYGATPPVETYAKCGPAVWTGGKYPVSNTMRELRWLYRPDPGSHAINVMSLQRNNPAAAAGLRIYHLAGRLPALKVGEPQRRWLGSVTENLNPDNSFGRTFRCMWEKQIEDPRARWEAVSARPDGDPVQQMCRQLVEWLDTCERYAEYLRFCGQNLHVMGCYQYSDENRVLSGAEGVPTARLPADMRDLAVRVFRENGIDVLANIEFAYHAGQVMAPESSRTDTQVQAGADTTRRVDKEGKQVRLGTRLYASGWNFLHPAVEQTMVRVAEDVADRFKDQPNFLGVNWVAYLGGEWLPAFRVSDRDQEPLAVTYDDATIARFERDTGSKIPVAPDDPERFQRRYLFLTSPQTRDRWIQWRCEKMAEFFDKISERLRRKRDDLQCVASLYFYVPHAREWKQSGLALDEYLRQWGWDPTLFRQNDHLWLAQMTHATLKYEPAKGNAGYAAGWEQNVSPEFYDLFSRPTNRAVMVLHHWIEVERVALTMPQREDWPRPYQSTMQAQATGDYAREPFTQALIGADAELVMFGFSHASLMIGHEQPMREFARVLRSLPADRFSPVGDTGFETDLAVRELSKGGAYYFYLANPGYWPVRGTVTLTGARSVLDLAANRPVGAARGETLAVPVSLKPYGVAAFRAEGGQARVVSWRTEPVDERDLAHLRGLAEQTHELLADPKVQAVLPPADAAFMQGALAQVNADLAAGQYARAWSRVTNWRFWTLLHEDMKGAAEHGAGMLPAAESVDVSALPSLEIAWTKQAPDIDGRANDPAWQQSQPATGFVTADKLRSPAATSVRAAYDGKSLYLAMECADPEPQSVQGTARGEMELWSSGDDAVAIFLQPDPEQAVYYQFAVGAGGARFDQQVVGGARDYDYAPPWQAATTVTEESWLAEVAIPFSGLSAVPEPGEAWRGNFFRRFRGDRLPASFWSWVASDAHDTSRFGVLRFLPPA